MGRMLVSPLCHCSPRLFSDPFTKSAEESNNRVHLSHVWGRKVKRLCGEVSKWSKLFSRA